jgi:hypothetical protein
MNAQTQNPDVEEAWAAEVATRVRDLVEGRAETIPAEQAFREARAKLARRPERAPQP